MKILIISDIHGNYEALKTAYNREKFDKLLFLGDAVDYGPEPEKVIDFLRENSDINIMGNHDYAVVYNESCNCAVDMLKMSDTTRKEISLKLLSKNDLDFIKTFKDDYSIELDNKKFYLTHGSPYNNHDGYLFASEAEKVYRDKKIFNNSDYILIGHTHFMMYYRNKIINPGSCGQPRDGNYMPSYALLDTGKDEAVFKRFDYDAHKNIEMLNDLLKNFPETLEPLKKFYS